MMNGQPTSMSNETANGISSPNMSTGGAMVQGTMSNQVSEYDQWRSARQTLLPSYTVMTSSAAPGADSSYMPSYYQPISSYQNLTDHHHHGQPDIYNYTAGPGLGSPSSPYLAAAGETINLFGGSTGTGNAASANTATPGGYHLQAAPTFANYFPAAAAPQGGTGDYSAPWGTQAGGAPVPTNGGNKQAVADVYQQQRTDIDHRFAAAGHPFDMYPSGLRQIEQGVANLGLVPNMSAGGAAMGGMIDPHHHHHHHGMSIPPPHHSLTHHVSGVVGGHHENSIIAASNANAANMNAIAGAGQNQSGGGGGGSRSWANIASQPAKNPPMSSTNPKVGLGGGFTGSNGSIAQQASMNKAKLTGSSSGGGFTMNTGRYEDGLSGRGGQQSRSWSHAANSGGRTGSASTMRAAGTPGYQNSRPVAPGGGREGGDFVGGDDSTPNNYMNGADREYSVAERINRDSTVNPREFNMVTKGARYFVIKSYSEDDIHRSIKYSIWCSTEHGNKRLDNAYKEREDKGPIYLLFSVNGSGHFCGVAEMVSPVDYNTSAGVWAQDKWKGQLKVRWNYVKDVPNSQLRHIRLENNENKPVTNSRDTQEVPSEKGRQILQIIHRYKHNTCIFDDFSHYEKRQEEEESRKQLTKKPDMD